MIAQRFLVPVDFSEGANCAVEYAMELATKLHARVSLLHVIYMPKLGEMDISAYMTDIEEEARQAMEVCLKRVCDAGLEAEMVLVHGVPFRKIIDMAKDKPFDLIIMGTHGRTGLEHMLLGIVTEKVVRLAPCPVLVTR